MKQYLKNLFLALTGSSPFLVELREAKEQLHKSAAHMTALQDMYYSALEKWEHEAKMLEESEKRAASLQVLTENLRERIKEKDGMLKELQKALDRK